MPILFTLLLTFSAHAATKLEPLLRSDGSRALGITYAYDIDRSWTLTYTSSITREALMNAPPTMKWNLMNTQNNQTLLDWASASRNELQMGTFAVSALKPLFAFLPEMKNYVLVFANEAGVQLFTMDIGELCANYPANVRDLSNTGNKACVVDKSQLPDVAGECKERREYFEGMLKKGLLNCKIANEQLAKKGCEAISCK